MHLSLFVLWSATIIGLMTSALLVERQGFAAGCNPYVLDGTVLRGTCTKEDGTTASSSLELNQCIGNSFGDLVWQAEGGFGSSCSGCVLSVSKMLCECESGIGDSILTDIELNDNVGNNNSVLTCYIYET